MELTARIIGPPTFIFRQSSRTPGFFVAESKTLLFRNKLEVEGTGWDHGVPLDDMKRISTYLAKGYDRRVQEAELNEKLPQYATSISIKDSVL